MPRKQVYSSSESDSETYSYSDTESYDTDDYYTDSSEEERAINELIAKQKAIRR